MAHVLEAEFLQRSLTHHRAARAPAATGDGFCPDCGEPIPPARLAAQPGAVRCVECQALAERRVVA